MLLHGKHYMLNAYRTYNITIYAQATHGHHMLTSWHKATVWWDATMLVRKVSFSHLAHYYMISLLL
jgi:hypothetical protein